MKKILSVCLVLVIMLSAFIVPSSAKDVSNSMIDDISFGVLIDDVYYMLADGMGMVTGFDMDEDDTTPKDGIVIPETITYEGEEYIISIVGPQAFMECDYTSVTLPSTITYMCDGAFAYSPYLEKVVIPEDCVFEYFGGEVFVGTPFEAEIYSKDETIFGKNVLFSYIGNASEYVIPESVDIIVAHCFFMSGVKSVEFNNKIKEIPAYTFASCRNLKEITVPDSVENIEEGAFRDCTSLEIVTLGEYVASLGVDCFSNTKIKSIHLGQSVYEISGAFRDCKTLESVTVDIANTILITDGSAIYRKTTFYFNGGEREGLILEYYLPSKAQGRLPLKSNVRAIGAYAFYGCKGLEEVVTGNIEYVDYQAFCNSSIKKFSANGEYRIEDAAFRNCKNLETINLENVSYIGVGAFENCTSLKDVVLPESISQINELAFANTGITELIVSGSNCFIYESAFKGCKNLETVRLEDGVSYVGMNAFLNCPKLKTIYISKTVREFDDNAFNGCENVTFQVVNGSKGHDFVKRMGYNFETDGNVSFFERIAKFFDNILEILFGWIFF